MAMIIALSSTLNMFWNPGTLFDIWVLLCGLYTPELAVLPSIWPSKFLEGGIYDPFVYIHCSG